MAESFNLLRRVSSLDTSTELPAYSGVVIFAGQDDEGNNIEYWAGDRSGTVFEITNEWGSQAQADAIYKKIRGYRYQPYKASGTHIDPSSEIGDAVTIADTYGGVFLRATTYGRDIISDLEAPSKEEVEHEFQIQSPTDRQYTRFTRSVRASISLTASQIAAEVEARKEEGETLRASIAITDGKVESRVEKVGGDPESFWWKLLPNSWSVGDSTKTLFKVESGGATVDGTIYASSGEIGGFTIEDGYICTSGQDWGGSQTDGIYIGPKGIRLGSSFRVDSQGNLEARSGKFTGTVYAENIKYGSEGGYFNGKGITEGTVSGGSSGQIGSNTISTSNTTDGINTSLGYADYSFDALNGRETVPLIQASYSKIQTLEVAKLVKYNSSTTLTPQMICYVDGNTGEKKYIQVFCE